MSLLAGAHGAGEAERFMLIFDDVSGGSLQPSTLTAKPHSGRNKNFLSLMSLHSIMQVVKNDEANLKTFVGEKSQLKIYLQSERERKMSL